MNTIAYAFTAVFGAAAAAAGVGAAGEAGDIKVCRTPYEPAFGKLWEPGRDKEVTIPAGGIYGAATENRDGSYRQYVIVAIDGMTTLGADEQCKALSATIQTGDGMPIEAGEMLVAKWHVDGFTPLISVASDFQ